MTLTTEANGGWTARMCWCRVAQASTRKWANEPHTLPHANNTFIWRVLL